MSEKNKKNYYHNKGEIDAKKGKYEPPHDLFDELTTWSDYGMKKIREENDAYDKGWKNTREQQRSNSGK